LLEIWTAKANFRKEGVSFKSKSENELADLGQKLLSGNEEMINGLEVLGENMENTRRKVLILKPWKAYHAYGDMLHYYAVKNLLTSIVSNPKSSVSAINKNLKSEREKEWVNLGGQIIKNDDLDKLRSDIGDGRLKAWNDIHSRYDDLWIKYTLDKQKHAYATLCQLYGTENLTKSVWLDALDKAVIIQRFVSDQVYQSRKKDFDNPFRHTTFRNKDEMKAALGTVEENSFIVQVRKETEDFETLVGEIKKRG